MVTVDRILVDASKFEDAKMSGLLFREELLKGLFPVNNTVTFPTGFVAHSYSQLITSFSQAY